MSRIHAAETRIKDAMDSYFDFGDFQAANLLLEKAEKEFAHDDDEVRSMIKFAISRLWDRHLYPNQ